MLGSRVSRPRAQPASSRPAQAARRSPAPSKTRATPARAIPTKATPALVGTRRPVLLLIVFAVAAGGLVSRLVFWQVMEHAHLSAVVAAQRHALVVAPALRGQIFDASGAPLATDITKNLVYAVPRDIKDPVRTAALLAPVLNLPEKQLEDSLTGFSLYAQLAPEVGPAQSAQINRLRLAGIFFTPVIRRDYPQGQVAAQTLGFTNVDNHGSYGLEQYYNDPLSGKSGLRAVLKDTAGNDVRLASSGSAPAKDGASLYLSLDSFVQNAAETELAKAVKLHRADGGTVIVMDPRTGYILGAASTPTYDPNHYPLSAGTSGIGGLASIYDNPAVAWTYEPGSTFKIVTMAAGLDSGVITPNTSFFDSGVWPVGGVTLHNWNLLPFGQETMTQVLQHSANVGASYVSSLLGQDRFYKYVRRFGIGRPTGIDLAGEEAGILPLPGQKNWTIVNQFTNSFGQGLATTPMQMIHAVAAVANNGIMMKPQLVKKIVYRGRVILQPPVEQRRVVSAKTAHTLTHMLLESAIGGEAQLGLVKGYNIAAKTGTASIPAPGGGYIQGATIASITGYAPAENPRFVALVIINHPRDTQWGSVAAAPVLHDLFQDLFMYYHIAPSPHALYR